MGDATAVEDHAAERFVASGSASTLFDVEDVLSRLTNKEKVALLAGVDFWHTKGITRLGVPSIRMSDGPNGVRGTRFFNGVAAACFPCGTGLASTWNTDLLRRAGAVMGHEARAKGVHVLLGPTVNIQRSPLGGRGFESFSEDPVLSGHCAASIVAGIQETGVAASIKHYVANDQEHERMAVNSVVTERALREVYCLPFQIVIRDACPASFMTSYNKVNGVHVSESSTLIDTILRKEWQWEGAVMSDWYGTYSTADAINAGLDIEMPGPTRWRGQLLEHAILANKVAQHTLDDRVRQILRLVHRCIRDGVGENAPEASRDVPETTKLLRDIAAESLVLLKNEQGALPFTKTSTVAVIGPNAKAATYSGGGSATLRPYRAVTPFAGISAHVPADQVRYALGCQSHKMLPVLGERLRACNGQPGITFRAYTSPDSQADRQPVDVLHLHDADMYFVDYYHSALTEDLWWGELEATFTPEETCDFEFGLCVFGTARLYIDGKLLIDNETVQRSGGSFFNVGTVEETGVFAVTAGQSYSLKAVFASGAASKLPDAEGVVSFGGGGVRLGGARVIDPEEEIRKAAELARSVDQVVLFVGLNSDYEQEGHDRTHMDLPGRSNDLIAAVARVNPRTVVVVQSGTPVRMPWAESVAAIVQAWYGGNELGGALADVLFGDVNPSGKLSLSFPERIEDNPAYLYYRSERGRVLYGEDIYVGYKFYETVKRPTLWSFGWGLSYTEFSLSNLEVHLENPDSEGKSCSVSGTSRCQLVIRVDVSNLGGLQGAEVVQVYVAQRSPSIKRPAKELKGFSKVLVGAGETCAAHVEIERKYAASFWDETRHQWIEEAGVYDVQVGTSSVGPFLQQSFRVDNTTWWSGL